MEASPAALESLLLTGPKKSSDLIQSLGISQATFSRLLKKCPERVRVFGKQRAALYGLARPISTIGDRFPLFRIDEQGEIEEIAKITAVHERGFVIEGLRKAPLVYPGIPYFLSDHRPQGFLGRLFSKRNAASLALPLRLQDWSENQVWASLVLKGENIGGQLIVGRESFANYQAHRGAQVPIVSRDRCLREFERLAEETDEGTPPGSSAAGEQPKFTVTLGDDGIDRPLIVKYSPLRQTARGTRWADLLVAESIALEIVASSGEAAAAPTELFVGENRTFLASERFDRVGRWGRRGMISFAALEAEKIGSPSLWAVSAEALLKQRLISAEDARSIQWLDAFGALIANSDRHYGNLSFFFDVEKESFRLAPAYDMLPMFYAPLPQEEESFPRAFALPQPIAETNRVWKSARAAALEFWERVAQDARISAGFKDEAKKNSRLFRG